MSVQEPCEVMIVVAPKNRRGVVEDNYCAMHSYGNIIVTRKYRGDML